MSNNNKKTKNKHLTLNQNFHPLGAASSLSGNVSQVPGMPRLPTTGTKRNESYQHPRIASPKRPKLNSPIHLPPQASSPSLVASQRYLNAPMTTSINSTQIYPMEYQQFHKQQSWEEAAIIISPSQLKNAILHADSQVNGDKEIERMLCGAAKQLRDQRNKPDPTLVFTLLYLAKIRPLFFCSERIIEAFGSLLKSPNQNRLKNNLVPILVINIFYSAFHDEISWPDAFLKLFIEDSLGDRSWVDNEECKDFVDILISCFHTKHAAKGLLQAMDILSIPKTSDSMSSQAANSEDSIGGTDEGSCSSIPSLFSDKDSIALNLTSRYSEREQFVVEYVTKIIGEHLNRPRAQVLTAPSNDISRNVIRLLMVTAGIPSVRLLVAQKLDSWIQSPKLSKPTQDLLLTLFLNCNQTDTETLSILMRIKLKQKLLINNFITCIKEALRQNDVIFEIIFSVVTRNELANIRPNGSNIPLLSQLFTHNAEKASIVLAQVLFAITIENEKEDMVRNSHQFLKELIRILRADAGLNTLYFVQTLLDESNKITEALEFSQPNNAPFRERVVQGIVDLIVQVVIHSIPSTIRDSFTTFKADRKDIIRKFQLQTATIICKAVKWIDEVVLLKYTKDAEIFSFCLKRILFMESIDQYFKNDNINESDKLYIFRLISEVPVYEETVLSILIMGASKDMPLKLNDSCEICFTLIQRAANIYDGDPCTPVLLFSDPATIINRLFESSLYIHPEGLVLPINYKKPVLSLKELYFKVWLMIVIISAHLPTSFGRYAWKRFPTFRMMIEMIITNSFQYPPLKADEELFNQDYKISQAEKLQIIEFENYLAEKIEINESNSFLLQTLVTFDVNSTPRRLVVMYLAMEKYRSICNQLKLCSLLCQSRDPDYLLNIIEQQQMKLGTQTFLNQQMSWLVELVESKENNFAMLPVQCLAEYLLSQFAEEVIGLRDYHEVSKAEKALRRERRRKLIHLIAYFKMSPEMLVQLIIYLTKRLSSIKSISRRLAYKVLYTMVSINPEDYLNTPEQSGKLKPMVANVEENGWFYDRLLPYLKFNTHLETVCAELVNAIFYETNPIFLCEYVDFISRIYLYKTDRKLLNNCCTLVLNRKKIMVQILFHQLDATLKNRFLSSLFKIFTFYVDQHLKKAVYESGEISNCFIKFKSIDFVVPIQIEFVHSVILLLAHYKLVESNVANRLFSLFLGDGHYPQLSQDAEQTIREPLINEQIARRLICFDSHEIIDMVTSIVRQETLIMFLEYYGLSNLAASKILQILDKSRTKFTRLNKKKLLDLFQAYWLQGVSHGYKFAKAYLNYTDVKEEQLDESMEVESIEEDKKYSSRINLKKGDIQKWFKEKEDPIELAYIARNLVAELTDDKLKTKKLTKQFLSEFSSNIDHLTKNIMKGLFDSVFNMLITLVLKDGKQSMLNTELQTIRKSLLSSNVKKDIQSTAFWKILNHFFSKDTKKAKIVQAKEKKKVKSMTNERLENKLHKLEVKFSTAGVTTKKPKVWAEIFEDLLIEKFYQRNTELVDGNEKGGSTNKDAKHLKTIIFSRNRSYFLSLLLHKSNFATLNSCIQFLLADQKDGIELNPTAVLNFLAICLNSPKLWIDRDVDQTQKIVRRQDILQLTSQQMTKLIDFVVQEGKVESRVHLVIRVCCVNNWKTMFIAKLIQDSAQRNQSHRVQYLELYTRIYLQIPSIQYLFYFNATDSQLVLIQKEPSYIDKVTNNLITSFIHVEATPNGNILATNSLFRSWELSLTRIAASHPLLFIRQLPVIPAILCGKISLVNYEVFKEMGMLLLFKKFMPILHLLMPYIWYRNMPGITDILNLYMDLFICYYNVPSRQQSDSMKESNRELVPLLIQFLKLVANWIEHDTEKANIWISEHRQDFNELANAYPNEANIIRDVQSGVSNSYQFTISSGISTLRMTLLHKLRDCLDKNERRALVDAMDELNKIFDSQPELVETLLGELQTFYLNPVTCEAALRLTMKILQKNPKLARTIIPTYIKCLKEGHSTLVNVTLHYLHEIVILAQDYRYLIMHNAFKLAIAGNGQALSALHSAFRSLNTQIGC